MEFKNLAEVELLGEVPEGASVLAATADGDVVRVPGEGLGGGGAQTVRVTSNQIEAAIKMFDSGEFNHSELPSEVVYSCKGVNFEDAYATIVNGGVLNVVVCVIGEGVMYMPAAVMFVGTMMGAKTIMITETETQSLFMWTAEGVAEMGGAN